MKLSKKALADEAYDRHVAGQIDAFSGVEGKTETGSATPPTELPKNCLGCGRPMDYADWTYLKSRDFVAWKVQCGNCGKIEGVTKATWELVRQAVQLAFADRRVTHRKRRSR